MVRALLCVLCVLCTVLLVRCAVAETIIAVDENVMCAQNNTAPFEFGLRSLGLVGESTFNATGATPSKSDTISFLFVSRFSQIFPISIPLKFILKLLLNSFDFEFG